MKNYEIEVRGCNDEVEILQFETSTEVLDYIAREMLEHGEHYNEGEVGIVVREITYKVIYMQDEGNLFPRYSDAIGRK